MRDSIPSEYDEVSRRSVEQPIDIDDEDMKPPDQPQQSIQPPMRPHIGGLNVPLPDSPMQDSTPCSPAPPHDPPPPSPPPAGNAVQAHGSPHIHWLAALGTQPWLTQASMTQGLATASSANHCTAVDAAFMVAAYLSSTNAHGRGHDSTPEGMMPLTTPTTIPKYRCSRQIQFQQLNPASLEVPVEVVPDETAVEAPIEVAPAPAAIDAPSEGAVPAAKRPRQYDLPQQPWQPIPHLQPPLHPPTIPATSSSPAALPPSHTTASPTEPVDKKQKQQDEDEQDMMNSFHPLEPHDPPLLPLADQQAPAMLHLEASRSQ